MNPVVIMLLVLSAIILILSSQVKKELSKITDKKEYKLVKAKWQLIFGLLGLGVIILIGIIIFSMF